MVTQLCTLRMHHGFLFKVMVSNEIHKVLYLKAWANIVSIISDSIEHKFSILKSDHYFDSEINAAGFVLFSEMLLVMYHDMFKDEVHIYTNHLNKIYYICDRLNVSYIL